MNISIVVINWNSRDYLAKCLESIRHQRLSRDTEVVVVDGASFDGSETLVWDRFPEVDFIQSPENIGYGRCCNLGARSARGEFLLILNPDTELRPGAVGAMMAALKTQSTIGLVGARLIDPDGTFQTSSTHPLPGIFNTVFDCAFIRRLVWRVTGRSRRRSPFPVNVVSGACMMVRTSLFKKIGGFNPRFFMYGEDVDLCQRVRASGHEVCHVPMAEVIHHGGVSSANRGNGFSQVMIREAVDVFMRIHHGPITAFCCRALMAVSALTRLAAASAARVFSGRSSRERLDGVIQKWCLVLRWCFGAEKWVSHHFTTTPRRVICNA
jgi:GT2 family glycosyltransferase